MGGRFITWPDSGSMDDQVRGCVRVVALSPGLAVGLWMIR